MSILEKLKSQIEHLCVLFKMFLQFPLLKICMITVRALVQFIVYMNWFSMLLQNEFFRKILVKILACFVTSCPDEDNWHDFPKCLIQKNLNHRLSTYMSYSRCFFNSLFLRICMITIRAIVQLFVYINWFSMLFQIDFLRKLLVTILACFVTSCPHENNLHVFPKCLFLKNLNHNLSNYVTYLLNEQIQDVFITHFFEKKHDHRQRSCSMACLLSIPHENNWHAYPKFLF